MPIPGSSVKASNCIQPAGEEEKHVATEDFVLLEGFSTLAYVGPQQREHDFRVAIDLVAIAELYVMGVFPAVFGGGSSA